MTEDAESPLGLPWPAPLPWQDPVLRELALARGQWPHAWLIHGPRGIGKHVLALHLAQALLCESGALDGRGCGTCASCRYAAAGAHPDLLRVELLRVDPDSGELTATDTLGVDRIRAVTDMVQLTSHRGGAKVGIIVPAERMQSAAANALLKTLEEPPAETYLILVAEQVGNVQSTVVSRCRRLQAPMPDAATAIAWLAARGVGQPQALLAQAAGGPLSALALADPGVQEERRRWLHALAQPQRLAVSELALRIEAGGRDERKARLAHAIDWMAAWLSDLARVRSGGAPERAPDFAAELAVLARQVTPIPLFRYYRALLRQRALLAHPLQPRLVAEALLIDYRALF